MWCIIKLHNLLPQGTVGTKNMNSMPEDRRNQHPTHPLFLLLSSQHSHLQNNEHRGVSGEVFFPITHAVVLNTQLSDASWMNTSGLPRPTGQHPWDLQLPSAAANSFPRDKP